MYKKNIVLKINFTLMHNTGIIIRNDWCESHRKKLSSFDFTCISDITYHVGCLLPEIVSTYYV